MVEKDTTRSRRSVLKNASGIAVAGGISSTAIGSVSAREDTSSKISTKGLENELEDVNKLDGIEKYRKIAKMKNEDDIMKIAQAWRDQGFSPRIWSATVWETVYSSEKENHYTIRIPFDVPEDGGEAHITSSSLDSFPTVGDYYPNGTSAEDTDELKVITYKVDGSDVVTESATLDSEDMNQIQGDVQAQASNCFCSNWDLKCISTSAAIAAAGGNNCATCAATPAKWTCISCAGALTAAGINLTNCCDGNYYCVDTNPIFPGL
ncbi:hypothetical protein [Natrinema sp. H-ect4]|uniref:hypothetical protein n=1 Tax=Natrinema sp. H-ect4 TaxID=3242699 RepID=UPI0035A8731D